MKKVTSAEKAGLEALAAEGREELKRGTPPAVISPICNRCAKRIPGAKCRVHPEGIPKAILCRKQECEKFLQK